MAENENKISKSYSLTPTNIEWLRARALAMSTVENRLSDSLFLDNLITRERKTPLPRSTAASPQIGERDLGGVKRKAAR